MEVIKNIIFDLGGVLLNINYQKTANAFKNLGVKNFDELYSQAAANDFFENLETGKISEQEFYKTMQQYCNSSTLQQQVKDAWNAMLLDFRMESIQYLELLQPQYKLFLLSNTNSIHLTEFMQIAETVLPGKVFNNYFIKCYYSHLINLRKPYPSTYEFVLSDAGIKAEETLFIDDSPVNIEGAKLVGLQTHLLLPNENIEEIIL